MALDVETGSGSATADSYTSVDDFKVFCKARNYDPADFDVPVIEAAIREAADYLDTNWRFKGQRKTAGQMREFPRTGCIDFSGYEATGVPTRVKMANQELAWKRLSTSKPLASDLDRGGMVVSESVGPISTTYAQGAPPGTVWSQAEAFLKPYIRKRDSDSPIPAYATPMATQFEVGMHDEAPGVSDLSREG